MEDARRMVGWIPHAADDARCLEFALGRFGIGGVGLRG